jgi:Leucine-rich repeat (LRR) protein
VAICNNHSTNGTLKDGERFETYLMKLDFSGNKIIIDDTTFSKWQVFFLNSINLSNNNIKELINFAFTGLTQLEDLDLSRNIISYIDTTAFDATVNLSYLWLTNNNLTEIPGSTFSLLENLRHLDLSNNTINVIQPETFQRNMELEWLSLANNILTTIHPAMFRNQSNLSFLDLSGNKIKHIKERIFYFNTKLESLFLGNNDISEFSPSAFPTENELTYIDVSGNRIQELKNLTFHKMKTLSVSRNSVKCLRPNSFSNCKGLVNVSLSENSISVISDGAFYGLEQLKYLDLSVNNITNITASAFQDKLLYTGVNSSGIACVSNVTHLNLTKNVISSFNFTEFLHLDNSDSISVKFCRLELLDLSINCLSALDNKSVDVLENSTTKTNLSDNPWSCECSSSQSVYKKFRNNVTLYCATPEYLKVKRCLSLPYTCNSSTEANSKEYDVTPQTEINTESGISVRVDMFIFLIFAFTICVAIVVVLIITRAFGDPEPDDFWWEDKLAKRNY